MKHENYRELIALRLYQESSPGEARELEAHLATCESCAAFARELEGGLGAHKRAAAERDTPDLPAGWLEGLRRSTDELAPRRGISRQVLTFAAGIAAGLLVMLSVPEGGEPEMRAVENGAIVKSSNAGPTDRFVARGERPPRATTSGRRSLLASLSRR